MDSGRLPTISRKAFFKKPYPRFNRMDEFSRLGVSAMGLALEDAGMDEWTEKREVGIVVGTVYGCLQTDLDYHETVLPEKGAFSSPALFSYTLPNCFLGEAAARFGLTGPGYVVNRREGSGLSSVQAALEDLDCTALLTVVAGTCDLGCPPGFPVDLNVPVGAVFAVIEKRANGASEPYGKIHLTRSRKIMFNDEKVSDINTLINACLKQDMEPAR